MLSLGSMKSVTKLKGTSPVSEFSETSPLLLNHDCDTATNGGTRINSYVEGPIIYPTESECVISLA